MRALLCDARTIASWSGRFNVRDIRFVERPIRLATLRAKVDRLRWLLRQSNSAGTRLQSELRDLYEQLVEPVLPAGGAQTIVIVPDGPLHALPFAGLINPRTGRYLVQDAVVMTAPSLSIMVGAGKVSPDRAVRKTSRHRCRQPLARSVGGRCLGAAAAIFRRRSQACRRCLPRCVAVDRRPRDQARAARESSRPRRRSLRRHALVNDQSPSLSRLLLSPDSIAGDDGSLFVTELAGVRLNQARLVVLAACSTGTGPDQQRRGRTKSRPSVPGSGCDLRGRNLLGHSGCHGG